MSIDDLLKVLTHCAVPEEAAESGIATLESWAGTQLPQAYLDLLRRFHGVEGFVSGAKYLVLWPAEKVAKLNEGCSVAAFAPGLLLIGSDGGGTGYALDTRCRPMSVQEVPLVGMSLNSAKSVGASFEDFVRQLGSGDG